MVTIPKATQQYTSKNNQTTKPLQFHKLVSSWKHMYKIQEDKRKNPKSIIPMYHHIHKITRKNTNKIAEFKQVLLNKIGHSARTANVHPTKGMNGI